MVRQVSPKRTPGWKGVLAVSVAGAAVLWHILACMESPMAFSPSGKELAFVTMAPYGHEDLHLIGKHVYRLIVVSNGKRARIIERTDKHMLSAPAWSPDGQQLCYLRVPLLTQQQAEKIRSEAKRRRETLKSQPRFPHADAPPTQPTDSEEGRTLDRALPPLDKAAEFYTNALAVPPVPVQLVVRDAKATDVIAATVTVELPVLELASDKPGSGLFYLYLLARPQYAPDGQWVYFCAGNVVVGVNPKTGAKRLLAAPAVLAALSPDGKTIAAAHEEMISFVRTDGSRCTAIRWEKGLSPSGIAWADNETLALLSSEGNKVLLYAVDTSGRVRRTQSVPKPQKDTAGSSGELALAPDGKHVVVGYSREVLFLDAAGKVLHRWQHEKNFMGQPTFSPDGKRVAMKYMADVEKNMPQVTAIVFFSAEGKELSRVKVPPVAAADLKRPATKTKEE